MAANFRRQMISELAQPTTFLCAGQTVNLPIILSGVCFMFLGIFQIVRGRQLNKGSSKT